jgi:hypothetical protein
MKTKCQTLGYILDKKLQKILIISIFAPSISEFQADSIWPISILLCWCRGSKHHDLSFISAIAPLWKKQDFMKKSLVFFCGFTIAALLSFIACEKVEESKTLTQEAIIKKIDTKVAERQFAVILSKAVSKNGALRAFIKKEALKRFDKDYDVFYPYVKNIKVEDNQTFRDIILSYADNEEQLLSIEASVPKLNILVPDFSWVSKDCFNIMKWDTSSEYVAVGYDDMLEEHPVFYNGELLGKMPSDAFPEFPILITKSNERMKINPVHTKVGETEFEFVDEVFNGTREAEVKGGMWGYSQWDMCNENQPYDLVIPGDNFISEKELNAISPETIRAYKEFGLGWNNGVQRDYINYGMSRTNTDNGTLNKFERDLIYNISFTIESLWRIADSIGDPSFNTLHTGRDDCPEFDEALRRLWGDGSLEIKIEFYKNIVGSGPASIGSVILIMNPRDLMYVTKLHRTFQWNFFGNNWSSYSLYKDNVRPKWFYPGDDGGALSVIKNNWDLGTESDNVWVKISEIDNTTTHTITETKTFKQAATIGINAAGEWKKFKLGLSSSYNYEKSESYQFSVSYTEGSDDLGSFPLGFEESIVTAAVNNSDGKGYQLKKFGNDCCQFSIIPIDIRNEHKIIQQLISRRKRK